MDDELAAALAVDLDATFEALVRAHQDRLYTIAVRILGDPRDAEEVTQDAFVRAYRAIDGYDEDRTRALRLRPWLAAIAVNLARNRVVRRRRHDALSIDVPDRLGRSLADHLPAADDAASLDGGAIRREEAAHWGALVAGLPERYRIPILLRHVDGLSFPEMAEALGRPEGTLKAQVHRGLALLRAAHAATRQPEVEVMTA